MIRHLILLSLLTVVAPLSAKSQEAPPVPDDLVKQCYNDLIAQGHYAEAVPVCEHGLESATGKVADQLHFFTAYALYQQGRALAESPGENQCESARTALTKLQEATPHLDSAGAEQADTQPQLRESIRVYSERQEAILRECTANTTPDA